MKLFYQTVYQNGSNSTDGVVHGADAKQGLSLAPKRVLHLHLWSNFSGGGEKGTPPPLVEQLL